MNLIFTGELGHLYIKHLIVPLLCARHCPSPGIPAADVFIKARILLWCEYLSHGLSALGTWVCVMGFLIVNHTCT